MADDGNDEGEAEAASGPTVLDATDLVLGRMATQVAKRLLEGEEVRVVHAERAVISGDRREIIGRYREKRELGTKRKGPFFPRTPDRIFKRTVRGMLPYQKPRGREAYARLRVYMGLPDELAGADAQSLPDASSEGIVSFTTLAEVAAGLGYEAAEVEAEVDA